MHNMDDMFLCPQGDAVYTDNRKLRGDEIGCSGFIVLVKTDALVGLLDPTINRTNRLE